MPRLVLILLVTMLFIITCSNTQQPFGLTVMERNQDTSALKQQFLKLRNIDNNIFEQGIFVGKADQTIRFRLYKPKPGQIKQKLPLVVVYHGSGTAIGTDNKSQLGILQKLFAGPEVQKKYPAYVLAPQFPTRSSDYAMDQKRNVLYSTPRPCLNSALQLIDSLKYNLEIDSNRIYVVGFSMGGSTAINSLSEKPKLFAAAISISGIPQFDNPELSEIPIWLIHGIDDTENPINSDEQFYKEMNGKIRFWKLKSTTHNDVFTTQILGETLPKWLFRHVRPSITNNK